MKNILLITVLVTTSFVGLYSCHNKSESAPNRPNNVPSEAVWAGGVDGGYWFVVTGSSENNTFDIKIYNEYSGEVDVQESFVLNDNCTIKQMDSAMLVRNIRWYNGEEIFLKLDDSDSDCSLIPRK